MKRAVVVGRDPKTLSKNPIVGDGTDESLAERVLRELRPELLVICAGAPPPLGLFHELTWEEFETNWRADTKISFVWLRQALRLPLAPNSHIIVISSGAALQGSPVSGGYASAKRAQWFLAQYRATSRKGILRTFAVRSGVMREHYSCLNISYLPIPFGEEHQSFRSILPGDL